MRPGNSAERAPLGVPQTGLAGRELKSLEGKLERGERLGFLDGLLLYLAYPLLPLGMLARKKKMALSGERVFFNVNRHLNLTNICRASCAYCGFARRRRDPDAYAMTPEEAVAHACATAPPGLTELHITGGLHPGLRLRYYLEVFRALREALPGVGLKAFTAVEVDYLASREGMSVEAVLERLREEGVISLAGGGAEIFHPRVRRLVVDHEVDWERWSCVHRAAHRMGMKTPATMLYGHIEGVADRVDHVLRLRALQDETGGLEVFIPLRFQPAARLSHIPMASAAEALRVFAVSRLLLDNVPHLKVFWVMHGVSLAQLALGFGADDLDGTVVEYRITKDPSGQTPSQLSREELVELIREAGWQPAERDTHYRVLWEGSEGDAARPRAGPGGGSEQLHAPGAALVGEGA